ncbi:MAG: helix-turn-helix transcriptional regulator [Pyrinomonadaceae bacterium]|nr:helix-turn-helix transcriptional regulator [Pyrinomonadaceae bacterium]
MASKLQISVDEDIYRRLWRARLLIDSSFDSPLNLDALSSEACFSRYHFIRLFKRVFNVTPHQYLVKKRIERAKELLASSRLSVTDVCFEVGFQSLGSFSTLFHRRVGISPIIYRTNLAELSRKSTERARDWIPFCFEVMYCARSSIRQ